MDELHRRLIRIGLDALADDFGYALAGGYAVQAHQIANRVSDGVGLFAPINRATVEMPAATERVIGACEAAGFTVELAHQNSEHTYTRRWPLALIVVASGEREAWAIQKPSP
ncbi:hypothetical protein [Streptomyces soliscabiei]|uniref:hypothetical protein n=1 Tax=Streptomyces soliscabiei TaxID=588897 RepID=UPI0029B61E24|nr:hypothetical protein [Streptomyces sp. NY05-11A]MDX2683200.1 hypothetical protein [Streptomyces sp. NY05-11A]